MRSAPPLDTAEPLCADPTASNDNRLSALAPEERDSAAEGSGFGVALICMFALFGLFALVLGAGALAQWLYERLIALGAP
jgi:hypothetical protein